MTEEEQVQALGAMSLLRGLGIAVVFGCVVEDWEDKGVTVKAPPGKALYVYDNIVNSYRFRTMPGLRSSETSETRSADRG